MLTYKQAELLRYLDGYLRKNRVAPSFEEMKLAVNLKSKSGIHRLIASLEERGFIRRLKNRARAIEVIRSLDDDAIPNPFPRPTREAQSPNLNQSLNRNFSLPVLGAIAAGNPIEAVNDQSDHVNLLDEIIGQGNLYILKIKGDSMVEAGILDGDQAIIRSTTQAESGQIVAALVDNSEITLKRLRKRDSSVALEPANKLYETQIYAANRVQIQGVLVSLIRRY